MTNDYSGQLMTSTDFVSASEPKRPAISFHFPHFPSQARRETIQPIEYRSLTPISRLATSLQKMRKGKSAPSPRLLSAGRSIPVPMASFLPAFPSSASVASQTSQRDMHWEAIESLALQSLRSLPTSGNHARKNEK